jgi:hypothetical protein
MRQCAQSEGVFVYIGGVAQQGGDEISGANIVLKIAEMFLAKRIVAHVLNQASTIGEGVCLQEIVGSGAGKALQQHGLNLILPCEIHDLFVGEYGISSQGNRACNKDG